MNTKGIKLGCIIIKNGIYIDTWHDIDMIDQYDEGYIVSHNSQVFVFKTSDGYKVNEFWETPDLFMQHQQQKSVIESMIDKTYDQIVQELKKTYEN